MTDEPKMEVVHGETCPVCMQKSLTLIEEEREIPHFGLTYLFSMTCKREECRFHKSDIEAAEKKDPVSLTFTIDSEEDMKVRVVKSAQATIKIPRICTIEADEASIGYISNIEGVLNRVKKILEGVRDASDDKAEVKKAKNHLKKLQRIMWGQDSITISMNDPSGNSAIISEKTAFKKRI